MARTQESSKENLIKYNHAKTFKEMKLLILCLLYKCNTPRALGSVHLSKIKPVTAPFKLTSWIGQFKLYLINSVFWSLSSTPVTHYFILFSQMQQSLHVLLIGIAWFCLLWFGKHVYFYSNENVLFGTFTNDLVFWFVSFGFSTTDIVI